MGTRVIERVRQAWALLRKLGPYALVEIVLPGGTLIAMLLFLYQRGQGATLDGGPTVTALIGWALRRARVAAMRFASEWPAYVGISGLRVSRVRDGLEPLAMCPS